jgi:hypothetical protein
MVSQYHRNDDGIAPWLRKPDGFRGEFMDRREFTEFIWADWMRRREELLAAKVAVFQKVASRPLSPVCARLEPPAAYYPDAIRAPCYYMLLLERVPVGGTTRSAMADKGQSLERPGAA